MGLSQPRRSRVLAALAAIAIAAGSLPAGQVTRAATGDPVLLNEALVSHTGADTTEFVELYGTPGASLAGLALLAVEGDSSQSPGMVDFRLDFAATAHLGGNGLYLVGNPDGLEDPTKPYGVTPDVSIDIDEAVEQIFENQSQTLALVEAATAPAVGTLLTGAEVVRDAVGVTDGGPADQFFFGVPPNPPVVVGPDPAGFLPPGVARSPLGWDTDTASDWVITSNSLDASHTPTPASPYNFPPTANCGSAVSTVTGTAVVAPVSATDPDGLVVSFALSVAPPSGGVTVGSVVPAVAAGGTATALVTVGTTTNAGTYAVTVTATNSDTAPQLATCELAVTVAPAPDPTPEASDPTMDAFQAMLDGFLASGDVAPTKMHLLTGRLSRVEVFIAAGQDAAAEAQLQAFANQVVGLSPRWVSPGAAQALAEMAEQMAAAHPGD
jgi:hypothetical protein